MIAPPADAPLREPDKPGSGPSLIPSGTWIWAGPLLYLLVVAAYYILRYNGQWAESDSATFARYLRDIVESRALVPPEGAVYPNGYLDQAVSAFLMALSGLSVEALQQWAYPFLAALVVPVAWITFREVAGTARAASLATVLLLTQPDFLFVILRSSHEKFTRTLMLLCILLVLRTLPRARSVARSTTYTVLFYGAAFALVASNYLLANSFFLALGTAWALAVALAAARPRIAEWMRPVVLRLPYMLAGTFLIVFLFTFYVYPPASHDLLVIRHTWDLVIALVTTGPSQNEDLLVAYSRISLGWINLPTYALLSVANWIVLGAAVAIWIRRGYSWVVGRGRPRSRGALVVWLLFAGFGLQAALAIVADASGALGSNLQLRLFPSMSTVAVGLIAEELGRWRPRPLQHRLAAGVLLAGMFIVSALSIMKATNEPLFSNKWSFYRTPELEAIRFADDHLTATDIWTELDERLQSAYIMTRGEPRNPLVTTMLPTTRVIVVTEITRLRSGRILQALPVPPDAWRIYDNGHAQLYHLRPDTPYQQ